MVNGVAWGLHVQQHLRVEDGFRDVREVYARCEWPC